MKTVLVSKDVDIPEGVSGAAGLFAAVLSLRAFARARAHAAAVPWPVRAAAAVTGLLASHKRPLARSCALLCLPAVPLYAVPSPP